MKKLLKLSLVGCLSLFTLVTVTSCNKTSSEEGNYEVKEVDFYREKDKADRKIALRFYSETPNVPYVGVKQFFKEFYKTDVVVEQNDYNFKFKKGGAYIKVDTKDETLSVYDIDTLGNHPEFKSSTATTFLKTTGAKSTTSLPKMVDLSSYSMNTYKADGDAYVPFSLLSNISTATALFTIVYNEKALFEIDYEGELPEGTRMEDYYGDLILAPMKENKKRQPDMINFNYNLICLLIDNFRGFTSQMEFIDNNVLSLGLNGTLEKYYPEIKKFLLSEKMDEYVAGSTFLFFGLADGGHTGMLSKLQNELFTEEKSVLSYFSDDSPEYALAHAVVLGQMAKEGAGKNMTNLKKQAFDLTDTKFYYKFDSAKKLSYIGFDQFQVNYDGWDAYYKAIEKGQTAQIPEDTYGYVRGKLYQALADGAETAVLDLSTNGGGDSAALLGLVGLLNGGKGTLAFNDTANHYRTEEDALIDVNLDGKYDNKDAEEAAKLENMNIVLLTSSYAFSCGNLFPSLLKELGYKTIGEKTGGGSCAIMLGAMADGQLYVRSSYKCLSDAAGHNIDDGVEVDIDMTKPGQSIGKYAVKDYSNFYDLEYVANAIKQLFPE